MRFIADEGLFSVSGDFCAIYGEMHWKEPGERKAKKQMPGWD
jgi:hypothetical protein